MALPIGLLVAAVAIILLQAGIIILLFVGISQKFVGYGLAFEAISEDYTKCKAELKLHQDAQNPEYQQTLASLSAKLDKAEKGRKHVLRQYIKLSNEFAWFRSLMRETSPDLVSRAETTIAAKSIQQGPTPVEQDANPAKVPALSVEQDANPAKVPALSVEQDANHANHPPVEQDANPATLQEAPHA